MRRIAARTVTAVCLTFVNSAWSQDELPTNPATEQPAAAPPAAAASPNDAEYRQQVSYALGRNFAQNLRQNEIECELESLLSGISDTLRDAPPKWNNEQLAACLQRFSQEMEHKMMSRINQQGAKNQHEATDFLAQNGKREGVQTTASGLQYTVIRQGNGPSPTLNDSVRCNYRGELLNGTEFDSSARHGGPADFPVRGVIPGWTEALQKMRVGDKWQLFVPPNLAYGMDPPGPPIEANSLLVFEIELLEILPESR
jgi:FKBP-type peptidyl-prolyl cis-trans isomerase